MPSYFQGDAIFWVEVDRISPNPYQPRREFDEGKLKDLAESIRQYGILQPLTVTRTEVARPDGGMTTNYELIAGERRLRAARIAGLAQVPVIIRAGSDDARAKLELAIIENLQREDLNPVDRARAFERLTTEFRFKHSQIAEKIGKSREYVSNTLRLLSLSEEMLASLSEGKMSEGHARTLMMLDDRPEEQKTLWKEILYKKLTVREAESISRRIAHDRVRKKEEYFTPEIKDMEKKLTESLGTRVQIEAKESGGKIVIDYFSQDDLRTLLDHLAGEGIHFSTPPNFSEFVSETSSEKSQEAGNNTPPPLLSEDPRENEALLPESTQEVALLDDRSADEKKDDEDLYSVKNFSI